MARKNKNTGKLNLCSYKQSAKQKLDDLKENIVVDETLQKHYEFILANFEAMQNELDNEIAVIQGKKNALIEQFIAAPEKLLQLAKHIVELSGKHGDVKDETTNRKKKEAKYKNLKERLAEMKRQMTAEGINIEDVEANIKAAAEESNDSVAQ